MRQALALSPYHRWKKWGTERLCNVSKVVQRGNGQARWESVFLSLHCICSHISGRTMQFEHTTTIPTVLPKSKTTSHKDSMFSLEKQNGGFFFSFSEITMPLCTLPTSSALFTLAIIWLWFRWSGCVPYLVCSNGRQGERKPRRKRGKRRRKLHRWTGQSLFPERPEPSCHTRPTAGTIMTAS